MAADYTIEFDISTIKHLGIQMYSTLPPVIAELVSNSWDADATEITIEIPDVAMTDTSEIIVTDNGIGMTDKQIREAYLIVGRDRRAEEGDIPTNLGRTIMGRKGIGKFSAFGIATQIEVETVHDSERSRFIMDYRDFEQHAVARELRMPSLPPTGEVSKGTRIILRSITKFRNRAINVAGIRRSLARRFSIIGPQNDFRILVNGTEITADERDLTRLLQKDLEGKPYLWQFENAEIKPETGWMVSGWIGALDRTNQLEDGIQRGIVILARGKLVQEPFVFDATVGQQFALSYLVGELHAEFVDGVDDTIGTTRNSLVWDTEANAAFKEWGQKQVNRIAREWADKRSRDNESDLQNNPLCQRYTQQLAQLPAANQSIQKVTNKLLRASIARNPLGDASSQETVIQLCLEFMEFDAFKELADSVAGAEVEDVKKLLELFREWEVIEAKEMMRVTEGRITTIEKLQELIETNALEVPTIHNFLKEFPWVLDPRWTLVADEKRYSQLLSEQFPETVETPEENKRIDFLCVKESTNLIVVEIKRPASKVSNRELNQIEEYVSFMSDHVQKTTDPDMRHRTVTGYLLCGDMVDTVSVKGRREHLEKASIYVRRYQDLLSMVEKNHREFLDRYSKLREAKSSARTT